MIHILLAIHLTKGKKEKAHLISMRQEGKWKILEGMDGYIGIHYTITFNFVIYY